MYPPFFFASKIILRVGKGNGLIKKEVQDALNKFLDKINASFDTKKTEHIITIKFKLPVVKDKFQYIDRTNKGKGNSIKKVKRN